MTYDLVTLGETMIRLTPPGQQVIEQATSFDLHVGGSESNVAVGVARLGLRAAWVSRLTDNPLGRRIASDLRAQAVDVSHVTWTDEDRVGVYYLEDGPPPRGSRVIYDRRGSAMSQMQPDDLPVALFAPGTARLLHISGITPALSETAAQTTLKAAQRAKAAGWLISFDLNYRASLWTHEQAAAGCEPLMQLADILILPLRDSIALFGVPTEPDDAAAFLRERFSHRLLVITLGAEGALAFAPDGTRAHQPVFAAQGGGRVGGGDAFDAGLLYGWLTFNDLAVALRWGAACAAYKHSLPGDMPLLDRALIAQIVAGGEIGSLRR
jgi:2-dehydro-3-deoxygluconokinase